MDEIGSDRNSIMVDGAYNGTEQKIELERLLDSFQGEKYLVEMQNIGRAKNLRNHRTLYKGDIACPKWLNQGFAVTEKGVYYCLKAALENHESLKLTNEFEKEDIIDALESINPRMLNRNIKRIYRRLKPEITKKFSHACEICDYLKI